MPASNHAKALKGLSIAALIISALMIVIYIVGAISMAAASSAASLYGGYYDLDVDYTDIYDRASYSSSYRYDDYGTASAVAGVFGMLVAFFVVGAIMSAVCLVASIIALRANNKPEKYGKVFAWSIVGAVLGFISGDIVLLVLFIIMAVFANKDKKLYQSGAYFGAAPAVQQYGQYGVPQQGYQQGQPQAHQAVSTPAPAQPAHAPAQAQPAVQTQVPSAAPATHDPAAQVQPAVQAVPYAPEGQAEVVNENGTPAQPHVSPYGTPTQPPADPNAK